MVLTIQNTSLLSSRLGTFLGSPIFVKVPRPGDSEGTFSV